MPTFSFDTVTPSTLRAYHDLNATRDTFQLLQDRLREGRLTYDQLFLLRSRRGPEAAVMIGGGPVIMPRVRFDAPVEASRFLAAEVLSRTDRRRQRLVLDSLIAPLAVEAFEEAGWCVAHHSVLYRTDLTVHQGALDGAVQERPIADVRSGELASLFEDLVAADGAIGDTGSADPQEALQDELDTEGCRLFVLVDELTVLAAATLRIGPRGEAQVHMLGVRPASRGRGIGRRLHAHVLAMASEVTRVHMGVTDASNAAMWRIITRNGAERTSEQFQLRPVDPDCGGIGAAH